MTEVRLAPTRFVSQIEAREDSSVSLKAKLIWATPVIAAIASILDASFMKGLISSEVPGLILTILAAVSGFVVAITVPKEDSEQNHDQLNTPDPTQQK